MLVAFEGIDGAGKTTQVRLLKERLERLGMKVASYSFPRYRETLFGKCIAAYLNGQFGELEAVPPQSAALLFAGDRLESLPRLAQLEAEHDVVLLDRYVASNLAHQGARVSLEEREVFLDWLADIEYDVFHLPRAGLTLYLDMPAEQASRLIYVGRKRDYTSATADIHEQNQAYLAACRQVYQLLVETNADGTWRTVYSTYPHGELRAIDDIQEAVWHEVQDRIC